MPAGDTIRIHAHIERRHTEIDDAETDDLLDRHPARRQVPVIQVDCSPTHPNVDWALKMIAAPE